MNISGISLGQKVYVAKILESGSDGVVLPITEGYQIFYEVLGRTHGCIVQVVFYGQ